ncbi:hypothetical protein [Bacillus sp. THAF10]|uniref:hypothetical protein n=1 Tax=Bacillus sp. THAF10 TaxID=2587848 RepID=UPI001268F49F|nr:hypothetical protein [Bacillus sp. THAF10]
MEFVMMFTVYLFMLGATVMLVSGILYLLFKRLHFLIIVLLSMVAGYIISIKFEVPSPWFLVIFNAIASLFATGLIKLVHYAGKKAEQLSK